MKKFLPVLLFFIICYRPLAVIIQNRARYFDRSYTAQSFKELKNAYYSSQYVNKNPKGSIPDETLESFAGGTFLQGINPILIIHDQPPLGRYIIALSILVFKNEKTLPLILLIISALGIFLVAREVLKNTYLAMIPLGLFINEPMFLDKFAYMPLLEPIQLPFIIFSLYFFIVGIRQKNRLPYLAITSILIGFVISIRYFILGAVLTGVFLLYLLLRKQYKNILQFVVLLPLSLFVLLLSYYQTFRSGYTLRQVLGIQKYIFVYHKSAFIEPLSHWDLLMFNRWHTWWGDYSIISDKEWSIFWPISMSVILVYVFLYLFKKRKIQKTESVLLLWILLYSLMLSVGYSSTRYYLPLIPFLYILAVRFVILIFNIRPKSFH